MIRGIDVSHHNGTVNWGLLKNLYSLSWGAAKATQAEGFKDPQFPTNWRAMKAAGLVRMAYHFANPDNNPADDANNFLAYVNDIGSSDIMVMDMEGNPNNLPMLTVRDWLAEWADIVTRETGRKPFLYTGSGYITNNATKDLPKHYAAWWFPRYSYSGSTVWPTAVRGFPTPNNWGGAPDIWQFSQSFAGRYDANIADMTVNDLKTRGIVKLEVPMSFDQGDKTYIDQRMQAYSFWLDMRAARRDLLNIKAAGGSAAAVDQAQKLYDEAYASWKADQSNS